MGATLELPGDSRSDEIAIQLVACAQCGFRGAAVYEESRRGRLDAESWEHTGYALPGAAYLELSKLMLSCPRPRDNACPCTSHSTLSRVDESGRWVGLSAYSPTSYFPMQSAQDHR